MWQKVSRGVRSYRTIPVFLILFVCSIVQAQWPDDPVIDQRVQRGIDYLYNFEFDKAELDFTEVIHLRPDHPVGYFFRAMIQWERIISNFDDETKDDKLYKMLDVVIDLCEKRLDDNPDDVTAMFFKGGAVGFRGRLRSNRGKWLGAANDGIVALPLVQKRTSLSRTIMMSCLASVSIIIMQPSCLTSIRL